MEMQTAPSASGIVYLFGDRFVDKGRFAYQELVYGGAKVKRKDLADMLLTVAFLQLANDLCIQMDVVEYKSLRILTRRDVQVTRSDEPKGPLYGLEAAIWRNIHDDPAKDRVREIIARIFGYNRIDPWANVVDWAKEALSEQGFLVMEKEVRRFRPDKVNWSANETLIAPHEGKVDEVKAMFDSFRASHPLVYKQLEDSVAKGISSMEVQDVDD